MVANHYAVRHTTIELFSRNVDFNTKRKGLIQVL